MFLGPGHSGTVRPKGRVEMLFSAAEAACPRREAVKDVGWEGRQLTVSVTRLKVQGWA